MATSALSSQEAGTPEGFLEEGDILIQLRGSHNRHLWPDPIGAGYKKVSAGHLASSWLQQLCPKGNTHKGRPYDSLWQMTNNTSTVSC